MASTQAFDKGYYDRFYRDPKTRVYSRKEVRILGEFVCAYLRHLGLEVRRVLDLGCGLGYWQQVIAKQFPRASYRGVEMSEYLCESMGWEQGSVVDYHCEQPSDLVICQGVLQYLNRPQAAAAIANLAELCGAALYLEALTSEDLRQNCDPQRTDTKVHLRTANWYRRQLEEHFLPVGGGLYIRRDSDIVLYELEKPG
ncbi:MAG: methyltransferase [Planctomycetota bacterium]|jgi:hypothetical protein